jgi:hypothetical protein
LTRISTDRHARPPSLKTVSVRPLDPQALGLMRAPRHERERDRRRGEL